MRTLTILSTELNTRLQRHTKRAHAKGPCMHIAGTGRGDTEGFRASIRQEQQGRARSLRTIMVVLSYLMTEGTMRAGTEEVHGTDDRKVRGEQECSSRVPTSEKAKQSRKSFSFVGKKMRYATRMALA